MENQSEDIAAGLRAMLDVKDIKAAKMVFRGREAADISEILAHVDIDELATIFRLVPRSRRAAVFPYLSFEIQERLLEELPDIVVTPILNEMEPDDRTRLLEDLPFEIRNKLLLKLSPEERKIAWQLLSYEEGSVGRLMTPEYLDLSPDMKVSEVMEMMRWGHGVPEEHLNYLFVTDDKGVYVGDVSLPALVSADPPSRRVSEIMSRRQLTLKVSDEQSQAVDMFRKYDRSYIPVVDDQEVLRGIVTADDVFDVGEKEATEDIQQFGGQSTLEDSYFETPLLTLFRKRAGWLAVLFVGGTITASCLKHYEGYSSSMAWLIFFLPLIVSSGGNTGSQSASLIIRGLAVKEMELSDWYRVIGREVAVGLGLGLILATMGYIRSAAWDLDPVVSLVVGLALLIIAVFGAVAGAMLPFLFKRMSLDPAVISSPLLAQMIDIVGVVLFYSLAAMIVTKWKLIGGG